VAAALSGVCRALAASVSVRRSEMCACVEGAPSAGERVGTQAAVATPARTVVQSLDDSDDDDELARGSYDERTSPLSERFSPSTASAAGVGVLASRVRPCRSAAVALLPDAIVADGESGEVALCEGPCVWEAAAHPKSAQDAFVELGEQ
jgi:hypothetical protein